MTVIEQDNEIGYTLVSKIDEANDDIEPYFCIETYENSGKGLCGSYIGPDEPARPMVEGPMDCQECWRIYYTLPD